MSATPIGLIPIAAEPVWLLAAARVGADRVRLTLERGHTYERVVTLAGWREVLAVLMTDDERSDTC